MEISHVHWIHIDQFLRLFYSFGFCLIIDTGLSLQSYSGRDRLHVLISDRLSLLFIDIAVTNRIHLMHQYTHTLFLLIMFFLTLLLFVVTLDLLLYFLLIAHEIQLLWSLLFECSLSSLLFFCFRSVAVTLFSVHSYQFDLLHLMVQWRWHSIYIYILYII